MPALRRLAAVPASVEKRRPRGRPGFEAVPGIRLRQHVDDRVATEEPRRNHFVVATMRVEFIPGDRLAPDTPIHRGNQLQWGAGPDDASAGDDCHAGTEIRDVFDNVRREDHDHVLADLGQQVEEAVAFFGIEAGGGLVDDDQLRLANERLRDAEPLPHATRESRECLLAHVPQVDLVQQRIDSLAAFRPVGEALQHGQVVEHVERGDSRVHPEILWQVAKGAAQCSGLAEHRDRRNGSRPAWDLQRRDAAHQ
jgi:hypothetical protein